MFLFEARLERAAQRVWCVGVDAMILIDRGTADGCLVETKGAPLLPLQTLLLLDQSPESILHGLIVISLLRTEYNAMALLHAYGVLCTSYNVSPHS